MVFYPIHVNDNHWTLAVVDFRIKQIKYFDSMYDTSTARSANKVLTNERLMNYIRLILMKNGWVLCQEGVEISIFRFERLDTPVRLLSEARQHIWLWCFPLYDRRVPFTRRKSWLQSGRHSGHSQQDGARDQTGQTLQPLILVFFEANFRFCFIIKVVI